MSTTLSSVRKVEFDQGLTYAVDLLQALLFRLINEKEDQDKRKDVETTELN